MSKVYLNREFKRKFEKENHEWWNYWSSDERHPTNLLSNTAYRDGQWDMYFYLNSIPWWKRIFVRKYVKPFLPEKKQFIFTNHD